MKRPAVLISLTVVLVVVFLGLGLVAFAYSGAANVAASEDYLPGMKWFFATVSDNSIKAHAEEAAKRGEISEPAEVTDATLRKGASEYQAMCVPCLGTPGGSRGEFGRGMKPEPPDLANVAREMELREVYWVIHHGIGHTGMPAFGSSHSKEDLWAIATFVERFDEMAPARYEQWIKESGAKAGSALARRASSRADARLRRNGLGAHGSCCSSAHKWRSSQPMWRSASSERSLARDQNRDAIRSSGIHGEHARSTRAKGADDRTADALTVHASRRNDVLSRQRAAV